MIASKYGKLAKCSVFNLSKRELSKEESFAFLSLGLNFSLPTKQPDKESVFLGFEKFYKQLSKLKPISHSEEIATKVNLTALAHNIHELYRKKGDL